LTLHYPSLLLSPHFFFFLSLFFFFTDPAPTEIYTLSLHDALPISDRAAPQQDGDDIVLRPGRPRLLPGSVPAGALLNPAPDDFRSEEHTSELQSPCNLVCRLLLEKKKK